jgi:putative hydrolase of the HAD superfamily
MIKTIIFDFAWVLTLSKCFPKIAENLWNQYKLDPNIIMKSLYSSESNYVLWKETTESFYNNSCKHLGISFKDFSYQFQNWYILEENVLNYIKILKENYEIVLHSDNFDILAKVLKINPKLTSIFDLMVFSNDIWYNKTQKEAFLYTLNRINKKTNECIFIDDKEKNLIAPYELWIQAILYTSFEKFKIDLEKFIT